MKDYSSRLDMRGSRPCFATSSTCNRKARGTMKCRVCNADVLDIFLYCHCCSSHLRDPDLTREWNPSRANISTDELSSLSVTASSIPVPPPRLPILEDFRKRVGLC